MRPTLRHHSSGPPGFVSTLSIPGDNMQAVVALAVSALALAACDHVVPIGSPITQPPLAVPIQDTIDVYYPVEFQTYLCRVEVHYRALVHSRGRLSAWSCASGHCEASIVSR
jgi:hypothetical protein